MKEQSRIYDNNDGILQITLESPGCFYQSQGYCKMCYYGAGQKISPDEAIAITRQALEEFPNPTGILVGSFGSPLDEREVERPVLSAALELVNQHPTREIYIETHANTITLETLAYLREKLPEKKITIEMGLESANPEVLEKVIHKCLRIETMERAIQLIHDAGMFVALNIIYGLWGADMRTDFMRTCYWADEHGADEIIMFLLNIKPETYARELYEQGKLSLPKHPEFVAVLAELSNEILAKTYFSWFGERQRRGKRLECIPPDFAGLDPDETMRFYHDFMETTSVPEKRRLIAKLLNSIPS